MHSSYQHHETHYADLSLPVHERINDLHRRAERLAPAVADSALDSGCTDRRPAGPRQAKAWDMVAEAHGWNAISDNPGLVAEAERHERDGAGYQGGYGPDGFGITVTEPATPKTIKLEIFEPDGNVAIRPSEWPASEARQMSAYRMRWLGSRKHPGRRAGSRGRTAQSRPTARFRPAPGSIARARPRGWPPRS
jgi:hypothetical protein